MANKKKYSTASAWKIAQALLDGETVSSDDMAYLRLMYKNDADFRQWYDANAGGRISLTRGRVRNAKDAYDTYGFTPTPPRGKNGQDTASMIMRSGMRTNQNGKWADVSIDRVENRGDGREELYTATPDGGRTRTPAELKAIIRRGQLGATLGLEDQRIYDSWMAQRRQQYEDAARAQEKAQLDARAADERAAKFKLLGLEDDGSLNDLQVSDLISQRDARNKTNEEIYKQRQLAEIRERDAANRYAEAVEKDEIDRMRKEIDNGRMPDMSDADYAEWMNNGGSKSARWDYSDEDKKTMEGARRVIANALNQGSIDDETADRLYKELDDRIAAGRWKRKVTRRKDVPEGDGPPMSTDGRFYADGNKWVPYTPKDPKPSEEEMMNKEKSKHLLERVEKARREYENRQSNMLEGDSGYGVPFDAKAVVRAGTEDWNAVHGIEPAPSGEHGYCPVCGEPLDAQGYCAACGYQEGETAEPVSEPEPGTESDPVSHMKSSYL